MTCRPPWIVLVAFCILPAFSAAPIGAPRQGPPSETGVEPLHRPFDQILDLYVRDGQVYYRALKAERARLDHYVASLNVSASVYDAWSRDQQLSFWLDAYNAFVLESVIDHYPIRGRATDYPEVSIRQIPGAFDRTAWKAAGRSVTLDEIEKTILPAFKEPRAYLALGRGAVGSGRLRSEAFTASRLGAQMDKVQSEFVTDRHMLRIDRSGNAVRVTPILSWHQDEFVAAYDKADPTFAQRSPIERAIVVFALPSLLPLEREFIQKNAFQVTFMDLDWRLNDLTGGRVN